MSTEQSQLHDVTGNIAAAVATLKTGVAALLSQINTLIANNAQGMDITGDLNTLQQAASDLAGVNSEIATEQSSASSGSSSASGSSSGPATQSPPDGSQAPSS